MRKQTRDAARRRFLGFVAASPLAALSDPLRALAQTPDASPRLIADAGEALNVFELQAVAARTMRPAHYGYLETGVLDDATMDANRRAFARWGVRARRLIDVSKVDLSVRIQAETYRSPIGLAPVAAQRAYHHEGERPVARAARARDVLQILSTMTNISVETVISDRGGPVWQQLYPTDNLDVARQLVRRADAAGASAIVLTADLLTGGMRRETQQKLARLDNGNCRSCHDRDAGFSDLTRQKAMFSLLEGPRARSLNHPSLTWDVIGRIREWTKKPLWVKGLMTGEDADIAISVGCDGVIVSNHGGRSEESLVGTLDVLPEIAAQVAGRVPILFDGGVRRGTDVFKALALGADMVCIGRPYIWGLSAFGQEGVETALNLLDQELRSIMQQAGVTRIADISEKCLMRLV
jgi:(S)-2-hydroxy-acid oxidase